MNNKRSSWITYTDGKAIEHLHYLPYGETQVDQRATSYAARYTFTAKEKDEETGYSYFGARYYNSDLSVWLSVDPMSDKYPSTTPYAYCRNNPVILYDPNGMFDDWVEDRNGHVYWDENATSQETTKQGETYLGKEGQRSIGNDVWNYNSDGTTDEQRPVIISESNHCDDDNNSMQSNGERLNDISFGTALETGMISEACNSAAGASASASEAKIGQVFKIGGKVASYLGRATGAFGVVYTVTRALNDGNLTLGEGVRIGIQTASVLTSYIPGYGTAISIGLSAVDFFFGDKIEKMGSK